MGEPLEFNVGETIYTPDGVAHRVVALSSFSGERYYWLTGPHESLSLFPASAVGPQFSRSPSPVGGLTP